MAIVACRLVRLHAGAADLLNQQAADRQREGRGQVVQGDDAARGPPPDDRNPRRDAVRDPRLPASMTITADDITPPMGAERAQAIAQAFDLRALPPDFFTNPYPVYRALREQDPVLRTKVGKRPWLPAITGSTD